MFCKTGYLKVNLFNFKQALQITIKRPLANDVANSINV